MDTFWSRWPDTWVHGDVAAVDNDGLCCIAGLPTGETMRSLPIAAQGAR